MWKLNGHFFHISRSEAYIFKKKMLNTLLTFCMIVKAHGFPINCKGMPALRFQLGKKTKQNPTKQIKT